MATVVPLISAPPHRRIKILGQAATPPRRFSPARSFRLRLFQRGKLGHEEAARRVSQGLVGNIGEDHLADLDDRSFRRVRGRILDTNCEVFGLGEALRDLD